MIAVPEDSAVTTPELFTVAIVGAPLDHTPDAVASVKVSELPTHNVEPPDIAATTGVVITGTDAEVVDEPHDVVTV
jgi:hypothetical protein